MLDFDLLLKLFSSRYPRFPNSRAASYDELSDAGLTMGTLYIGRQGTGKTTSLARHVVDYFKRYPDRAIFVLDWSGSITDSILGLIAQEPPRVSMELTARLVYDELGNPDRVIPLPEFSSMYGNSLEEQAQRVANNLMKLAPELVVDAPFLAGLGLREIAPQLFRVCTAIPNDPSSVWQITEAKKLLRDAALLRQAVAKYGGKVPEAKWFFEKSFLSLRENERELRTYAILALLGVIEPSSARARVGYPFPGWTPIEAISKGLMVIVNGERLINQKNLQHYLFTQVYSLIMSELNRRSPANPADKPVALVMDEVYSLISIPGMAEEVGMLAPLYRSRKLELYIVLQSLSQLALTLRQQIWSIGNIVSFAVSNFQEAYELSQQIFSYDPKTIKLTAKSDTGQPIVETDRGQYLQIANEIQRMKHRECIIRRYHSEQSMDKYVLWVKQTKNTPQASLEKVTELKDKLLRARAVSVRDAENEINQRKIVTTPKRTPKPPAL
jgi:TraM recognition site of TraD and TraG